jgi:ABC-type multidrug transport system ATPase subunit
MTQSLQASLSVKAGPDIGKTFAIEKDETIIGRIAPAEIAINQSEISRRHARVIRKGGQYFIEDLGSSNGTMLNGQPIKAAHVINNGDEIRLGASVILIFSMIQTAAATMMDASAGAESAASKIMSVAPKLTIAIAGQAPQEYTLDKERITIGRAEDNNIVVNSAIMSRHHAVLELTQAGYEIVVLQGTTNTLTCQGRPVAERQLLKHDDVLRIDSELAGMMVSMTYLSPLQAAAKVPYGIKFGEKEKLIVGRDPTCDVQLDRPNVSRFHAQLTRVGRRTYITDLRSANGTFVNNKRVEGDIWLESQDTVRIGSYKFVVGEDHFTGYDEAEGLRVETRNVNKWVRKDLNLLQDISLVFQPREFICVVGQSGGGKSTLVDSIAGYRPATHGHVYVNDVDVYQNFDTIRNEIGYVPQKDIIHMELTVYQALDFAAQLRMPKDTSAQEREKRIMEVLKDLDLTHRKDVQISGLSGGQQKRVSIGVELLTRPGLFFLDEPTSGLDPGTETAFMHLMRRLADQGRTIIMVTHATKNVMLADKVVFLARGGYLAWFGPPNEALEYFDQYRSDSDRRTRAMEFDQIYAILDDPSKGKAKDWAERYKQSAAYQKYIVAALAEHKREEKPTAAKQPVKKQARKGSRTSSLQQFVVLSKRNVTILTRDRSSMILMLVAAPGVGALDLILAPVMGSAPFAYMGGDAANGGITLFLLSLFALLVGGMSQMREFVKESDIYMRERLVNLKIVPYVTSKIWVALLLAFYHGLAYTVLHYLAFSMPGGVGEFFQVYVTLVLATLTGMLLGLLASALSPNAGSAPLVMIMMIIPLIVLSGALAPVPPAVSQFASSRWAFQSLLGIVGAGQDIAGDACWQLDETLRDAMTLDDMRSNQCRCMGTQMFSEDVCNFPGVGNYYVEEIAEAEPIKPPPLAERPPEPIIPAAPKSPSDNFDELQMASYLNALSSYQSAVQDIQDNYRNQMDLYQVQAEVYEGQMMEYQEKLARYNIARISAVEGAKGVIDAVNAKYSWAWVNKRDPAVYFPWLFQTWLAQIWISMAYYIAILFLIKRKDVK